MGVGMRRFPIGEGLTSLLLCTPPPVCGCLRCGQVTTAARCTGVCERLRGGAVDPSKCCPLWEILRVWVRRFQHGGVSQMGRRGERVTSTNNSHERAACTGGTHGVPSNVPLPCVISLFFFSLYAGA